MRWIRMTFLASLLAATVASAAAEEASPADLAAAARAAGTVNGLCPVMGRAVTVKGGALEYRGERVGFCCPGCVAKFRADPVFYMNKMRRDTARYAYTSSGPTFQQMRAAAVAARSANGVCPIMGRLVTPTGGSVTYDGQTIAFCCKGCVAKFQADPQKSLRAMRADPMAYGYDRPGPSHEQIRAARESVGSANGRCPVMGRPVAEVGGSVVYRGEKIAFCCVGCIDKFNAAPESYMAKLRGEPTAYGYVPAGR